MHMPPLPRAVRGVTLIETLIALVVVGFGFVTLAGFGLGLGRHADAARQRSEATRLAQEKIESLRAFIQIESGAGGPAYADLASGADTAAGGNATFTRRWRVTPGTADLHRLVAVTVEWADRAGAVESVTLRTAVSRSEPALSASLALPPRANDPLRRTRERALDIPFEAVPLGGANRGRSALAWSAGSTLAIDDASGTVLARCPGAVDDATDLTASCAALQGLLLDGYIGGDLPAATLAISFDALLALAGTTPECRLFPAADQNAGTTLAGTLRYRCLIQPLDHDGDPATPRVWSGRPRFAGLAAGSAICRVTGADATVINAEHPETYTLLAASLGQQNYAISASGTCPPGSVPQQAG